jgi:hypothetical protein
MSTAWLLPLVAGAAALTACSGAAEPELALLGGAPAELPAWVDEPDGLPVKDVAHVADVDHLSVFAGRDDAGQWCVVLALHPTSEGSDWGVAASCAASEQFAADGVWVTASPPSARFGGALLLPDDFSGEIGDDWERVNDNLAIRR